MKKNLYTTPSISVKSVLMESLLTGLSKDDTSNAGTGDGTGHNDVVIKGPSTDEAGAKIGGLSDWEDL